MYTELQLQLELYKQTEIIIKRICILMGDQNNLEQRKWHSQCLPNYIMQMHTLLKTIYKIVFKPLPYCVFQEKITDNSLQHALKDYFLLPFFRIFLKSLYTSPDSDVSTTTFICCSMEQLVYTTFCFCFDIRLQAHLQSLSISTMELERKKI